MLRHCRSRAGCGEQLRAPGRSSRAARRVGAVARARGRVPGGSDLVAKGCPVCAAAPTCARLVRDRDRLPSVGGPTADGRGPLAGPGQSHVGEARCRGLRSGSCGRLPGHPAEDPETVLSLFRCSASCSVFQTKNGTAKCLVRGTFTPLCSVVPLFFKLSIRATPPRACPCTCVCKQKARKKWNNGTSSMFHAADQGKPCSTSENQKRHRFARVHTFLPSDQGEAAFRRVPFLESKSGTRRSGAAPPRRSSRRTRPHPPAPRSTRVPCAAGAPATPAAGAARSTPAPAPSHLPD